MVAPGRSPPASVLELPFERRPLFSLLGFDLERTREVVSLEYTGYGWCAPARLWLHGTRDVRSLCVEEPLVLALHSADDGPALAGDILLEFALEGLAPVAAPLSLFLARWLPRLLEELGEAGGAGAARPIVLAMCNPHRAQLAQPVAAGGRPVYYALGDVDSWLDLDEPAVLRGPDEEEAGGRMRLCADQWHAAGATTYANP
jgi:hypothetical protein